MGPPPIKSVAVIGAGASGAATAAALASENYFDVIRVFERRETPGGTWIYDPSPSTPSTLHPGKLPPAVDPPLHIPNALPQTTRPTSQYRYDRTPIYSNLTTNVPEIAMSFSDTRFAYGPFVPHWIPKQYIQNYFALHHLDKYLVLNTTVEDVSLLPSNSKSKSEDADTGRQRERWKLTLRRHSLSRNLDIWWSETFDAVVIANGHYSVPFIPSVPNLEDYLKTFPGRVLHSKFYRSPSLYRNKRVVVIGNSASGHDITTQLLTSGVVKGPLYQSRRTPSRWDGSAPPEGLVWKPIISSYDASTGAITFADGSVLEDVDAVIYCTGYKPSFPFWNATKNGGELFDYENNKLRDTYLHTFHSRFPSTLALVGVPRVLTFRSFEYQAIAIARLFSGREARPLPHLQAMKEWERGRAELVKGEKRKFHDVPWDNGETMAWFRELYEVAGLPRLEGEGRVPPVLDRRTRWAIENVRKYPEPGKDGGEGEEDGWVVVHGRDSLHFI
ncbi:putative dimethylaniline monooxygenase [Lophiotrema nucula]|uniref:Putative dimethylaniline monooxygenase n=1 Tax=Lophiotrema nucula TaxID=690887 RepID=A0A6A5YLM8_9PLEO|nr:putative dimethylaniline monooxygenase [Lophiotrema nucula]